MQQETEKILKTILRLLIFTSIVLIVFYLAPKFIIIFLPFLIGWLIASIINPFVNFMETKIHIKRKYASIIALVVAIAVVGFLLYLLIYRLVLEGQSFIDNLPGWLEIAKKELNHLLNLLEENLNMLPDNIVTTINDALRTLVDEIIEFIKSKGLPTLKFAGNFVMNIPRGIIFVITMILSAYFISADKNMLSNLFKKILPENVVDKSSIIKDSLMKALGGYIKAQAIILTFVFILLLIGFSVLKVEYVLLLAFVISLFDALPFFGTGGILIPWSIYSFLTSNIKLGIGLLIIYVSVIVTRQFIEPKILGDNIGLHPLATLLSMYIGLTIFGVLGLILGPVSLVIIKTLYQIGVFDGLIESVKYLFAAIKKALT